jgi:hypothetical protein
VEPPQSLTVAPLPDDPPVGSAAEAERRMVELLNRERRAAGLPPLVWDEVVAGLARAHSGEMYRTRTVAHILPATGSVIDHVRGAERNVIVEANVAHTSSIGEAHRGLMNAPGTREIILSRDATHVGLGAALGENGAGRRDLYITEVFTRERPVVDPAKAIEQLRERVAAIRSVGSNPELDAIAQVLADGLAHGRSIDDVDPAVKKRIHALGKRYVGIAQVIVPAIELDGINGATILGNNTPDDVGLGVAQGTHPELGDNTIFVMALLATRR